MADNNILPKRIRRNEVSILLLTEEIAELKHVTHALYDSILFLSRKVFQDTSATAADMLMMPPWYSSEKTGDVMTYPANLDLHQKGLGAFRVRLSLLTQDEREEIKRRQFRVFEHLQQLEKREKERADRIKNNQEVS